MPVPVMLVAVNAVVSMLLKSRGDPSGRSTGTSYPTAPGIASHCQAGIREPEDELATVRKVGAVWVTLASVGAPLIFGNARRTGMPGRPPRAPSARPRQ